MHYYLRVQSRFFEFGNILESVVRLDGEQILIQMEVTDARRTQAHYFMNIKACTLCIYLKR